jgi:hypothetical protein
VNKKQSALFLAERRLLFVAQWVIYFQSRVTICRLIAVASTLAC